MVLNEPIFSSKKYHDNLGRNFFFKKGNFFLEKRYKLIISQLNMKGQNWEKLQKKLNFSQIELA